MTEQELLVEMLRGKDIAMVLMVVLWIVVFVFIALIIYETNRVISCSNEGKTRMAKSDATHTGTYEGKEYLLKTKTQNKPIWRNRFEMWHEQSQQWLTVPPAAIKRYAESIRPI